jgi:phytanoyl-CoA hydroxylase
MALTHEEIHHFRHSGYLALPVRLPEQMQTDLKTAIGGDIAAEVEPVVRDGEGRAVRLSKILERAPVFYQAATWSPLLDALESLLGPHIELVKNRHNHATLNLASAHTSGFHRDLVQWSRGLVSVILYLEQTTLENGCTHVVPGTHLLPGVDHLHHIDRDTWIEQSGLLKQALPVPMAAGTFLAIDGLVYHRVGANTTAGTRMSLTLGYHSADELAATRDDKRLLVRGEELYMGNDRNG